MGISKNKKIIKRKINYNDYDEKDINNNNKKNIRDIKNFLYNINIGKDKIEENLGKTDIVIINRENSISTTYTYKKRLINIIIIMVTKDRNIQVKETII